MSAYPPHYAYPSAPPLQRAIPNPPRLHWGWVLALNIITRGLFGAIWMLVQANWVRRASGRKTAFIWSIVHVSFFPVFLLGAIVAGFIAGFTHTPVDGMVQVLPPIAIIGVLVLYTGSAYTLYSELQEEPIGLSLSGVMTFFFAPYYFQYHLRDWGLPYAGTGASPGLTQPAAYPRAVVPAQSQTDLSNVTNR